MIDSTRLREIRATMSDNGEDDVIDYPVTKDYDGLAHQVWHPTPEIMAMLT